MVCRKFLVSQGLAKPVIRDAASRLTSLVLDKRHAPRLTPAPAISVLPRSLTVEDVFIGHQNLLGLGDDLFWNGRHMLVYLMPEKA